MNVEDSHTHTTSGGGKPAQRFLEVFIDPLNLARHPMNFDIFLSYTSFIPLPGELKPFGLGRRQIIGGKLSCKFLT